MRGGQKCRLDVSTWNASPVRHCAAYATVIGVVVGERRHRDDASRVLYYFHTLCIERPIETTAAEKGSGSKSSSLLHLRREKKEELSVGSHALSSAGGFKYSFDGWYDEIFLYKIDEEASEPLQREWCMAMEQNTSPCELLYLCYASKPWFESPFTSLQYLRLPDHHLCYSVSICHRCLSPFVAHQQLHEHLTAYCTHRRPPGVLLYDDTKCGRRVYYVDGAKELHYGRCLCLLGKSFLESKQVENDVDIYEFFVVTTPRASLPYVVGEMDESIFRHAAAHFDAAHWDGDVVIGYFSRIKHTPQHCLSCIVTLPVFQQQRVGFFMLDIAYRLTAMRQERCGCEAACGTRGGAISRPFSPHGQAMLMAYWRQRVTAAFMRQQSQPSSLPEGNGPYRQDRNQTTSHEGNNRSASIATSFSGLHERVLAGGCYIHEDDLRFFAHNDERCFYARVTPDVAAPTMNIRHRAATAGITATLTNTSQLATTTTTTITTSNNNNNNNNNSTNSDEKYEKYSDDNDPLEFIPPSSEFVGSLLLFEHDVVCGGGNPGAFDERFWARDASGRHPYTRALFHY